MLIKEKVERALERRNEIKPFTLSGPYEVELTFLHASFTNAAEMLPVVEKVDEQTLRFTREDWFEAFQYLRCLINLAHSSF